MMTTNLLHGRWRALALAAALALLPGCGYTLRGKVVRGPVSGVEPIHVIDPALKGAGIPNAEVAVRRDPNTPNQHLVGRTRTDAGGNFSMRIKDFGAGWMHEEWLVQGAQTGYQNAESIMKLPAKGGKWRLLITLAPGTSTSLEESDPIMEDYEKFK
ncbi:MAG: carboxypeptidase-like regulatory domain-containing protein [Phycisphaerales bacterium]|nr:carboxypeptidase-like regulatory domain-containing protein [Phycisphaerales bacterium]MCI0675896.1 carboxypeptidase-like regulatory domain-containing protein [Phycisphaerales bacterium]